jgi:hypothetical protein
MTETMGEQYYALAVSILCKRKRQQEEKKEDEGRRSLNPFS